MAKDHRQPRRRRGLDRKQTGSRKPRSL